MFVWKREMVRTAREILGCDKSSHLHQVEIHLQRALFLHARLIQAFLPGVSAQNSMTPQCLPLTLLIDCPLLGIENFHRYVFFGCLCNSSYTIHMAFPLSLIYLKTQLHILFSNPQTNQPVKSQYVTLVHTCVCVCKIHIWSKTFYKAYAVEAKFVY